MLIGMERVKHLLEGVVLSRSDPDRTYVARVLLQANFLCPCNGSIMRDAICIHLRETVEALTLEELRAWIFDAQVIPREISAPVNE